MHRYFLFNDTTERVICTYPYKTFHFFIVAAARALHKRTRDRRMSVDAASRRVRAVANHVKPINTFGSANASGVRARVHRETFARVRSSRGR